MDIKDIIILALVFLSIVLIVLLIHRDEEFMEVKRQKDNIWRLYTNECERNIEQLKKSILRDDIEELSDRL